MFQSESFEMIIILPNHKYGIHELEKNFEWGLISKATYFTKEVEVSLPKFRVNAVLDLKEPLKKV